MQNIEEKDLEGLRNLIIDDLAQNEAIGLSREVFGDSDNLKNSYYENSGQSLIKKVSFSGDLITPPPLGFFENISRSEEELNLILRSEMLRKSGKGQKLWDGGEVTRYLLGESQRRKMEGFLSKDHQTIYNNPELADFIFEDWMKKFEIGNMGLKGIFNTLLDYRIDLLDERSKKTIRNRNTKKLDDEIITNSIQLETILRGVHEFYNNSFSRIDYNPRSYMTDTFGIDRTAFTENIDSFYSKNKKKIEMIDYGRNLDFYLRHGNVDELILRSDDLKEKVEYTKNKLIVPGFRPSVKEEKDGSVPSADKDAYHFDVSPENTIRPSSYISEDNVSEKKRYLVNECYSDMANEKDYVPSELDSAVACVQNEGVRDEPSLTETLQDVDSDYQMMEKNKKKNKKKGIKEKLFDLMTRGDYSAVEKRKMAEAERKEYHNIGNFLDENGPEKLRVMMVDDARMSLTDKPLKVYDVFGIFEHYLLKGHTNIDREDLTDVSIKYRNSLNQLEFDQMLH